MPRPAVIPPTQRRSQDTLERLLDGAARLLETRSFDELTVADVASSAGCSVGAFYGRLRDKEGLLHALDERYFAEFQRLMRDFVESDLVATGSLSQVLDALSGLLLRFHGQQRGLLRALILHARSHRDAAFRSREERLWRDLPRLRGKLLRFRSDLSHADPGRALVFAFLQMLYALREMTLWPDIERHVPVRGQALARQLARAAHAYLTIAPSRRPPLRRR